MSLKSPSTKVSDTSLLKVPDPNTSTFSQKSTSITTAGSSTKTILCSCVSISAVWVSQQTTPSQSSQFSHNKSNPSPTTCLKSNSLKKGLLDWFTPSLRSVSWNMICRGLCLWHGIKLEPFWLMCLGSGRKKNKSWLTWLLVGSKSLGMKGSWKSWCPFTFVSMMSRNQPSAKALKNTLSMWSKVHLPSSKSGLLRRCWKKSSEGRTSNEKASSKSLNT